MPDWTHDYFERGYAQRWGLLAPSDRVRQEASFLWTLLQASHSRRLIDIGCGHGKHALALAGRGSEIIGIDFAVSLLNRARQLAEVLRIDVRLIRGDMRQLPLRAECAGAAIVMDAFGFFDTEAEHDAVLREAARVLIVGGRLAMKVMNGGLALDSFRDTEREERDGVVVSISNALTDHPPRLMQRISITGTRGAGEYERRQRLYRVDELSTAFERAGFDVAGVFGSPDGVEFNPATSSAIWIVGRRRSTA
jgi:ubiquinone/menaquinone biosynthesis C-methylase UbiE